MTASIQIARYNHTYTYIYHNITSADIARNIFLHNIVKVSLHSTLHHPDHSIFYQAYSTQWAENSTQIVYVEYAYMTADIAQNLLCVKL